MEPAFEPKIEKQGSAIKEHGNIRMKIEDRKKLHDFLLVCDNQKVRLVTAAQDYCRL